MRIPRTAASFGMLLFVSATAAQELPGPAPFPMADDDVSALVSGDFSGDGHMDAVVLADGHPVLCDEVEVHQTYVWDELEALDIATLHGTGTDGRDQLVAVGSDGLSLLELQLPASPPWFVLPLRDAGWWTSTFSVRTDQIDGLNGDDIVAVTPTRVLIAYSNSTGGWMTAASDTILLAGLAITGVELVDWDGVAGTREIAVIMAATGALTGRIRFMKPNGTTLELVYLNCDRIVATPVAATGIGTRYLATVGTDSNGAQALMLLASDDREGFWSLGAAGVYDIAAGDWNGDEIDDLVLATNLSRDVQLYGLVSDEPSQLTVDTLDLPPNSPDDIPLGHPDRNVTVQDGGMALADVDHDGDVDLIGAVQGDYAGSDYVHLDPHFSTVERTLNGRIDQNDYLPWPAPGAEWPEYLPLPSHSITSGNLEVSLLTPITVLEGAGPEYLEYAVWRTPTMGSSRDSTPIATGTASIGEQDNGEFTWTTLTLHLNKYDDGYTDRYTLVVRQVNAEKWSPALMVTLYSELDDDVYASGWNVVKYGPSVVSDGPEPGESGGHSSGPPPPPPPPQPPQ